LTDVDGDAVGAGTGIGIGIGIGIEVGPNRQRHRPEPWLIFQRHLLFNKLYNWPDCGGWWLYFKAINCNTFGLLLVFK